MTLGLFGVVVNGLLLLLVAWVANTLVRRPVHDRRLPGRRSSIDAIVAAIVASIAMGIITAVIGLVVHD